MTLVVTVASISDFSKARKVTFSQYQARYSPFTVLFRATTFFAWDGFDQLGLSFLNREAFSFLSYILCHSNILS